MELKKEQLIPTGLVLVSSILAVSAPYVTRVAEGLFHTYTDQFRLFDIGDVGIMSGTAIIIVAGIFVALTLSISHRDDKVLKCFAILLSLALIAAEGIALEVALQFKEETSLMGLYKSEIGTLQPSIGSIVALVMAFVSVITSSILIPNIGESKI